MPVRTSTPIEEAAGRLTSWAAHTTGRSVAVDGDPTIPPNNGMVAPTILFTLRWQDTGDTERFVLRGGVDEQFVPVFDVRSIELQSELLAALHDAGVAVPTQRWFEADEAWLGFPFLVMDHVEGVAASDAPPYVLDGWMLALSAQDRAVVEQGFVELLASIHAVAMAPVQQRLGALASEMHLGAPEALERCRRRYAWGRRDGQSQLIESLIDWCATHLPDDEGEPVLCWGDARPGNLLYRGTDVAAVLDWDGAAIGAREFDIAWAVVFHRMFQDVASRLGLPGLPDMFERERMIRTYERAAGVELRPLAIYEALAALKLAAGSIRGHHLEVYGRSESEPLDDLIAHQATIRSMLTGDYWPR